jgi:hypothetical protein
MPYQVRLFGTPFGMAPVRTHSRSLTWHGQAFRFQYLPSDLSLETPLWAVSRSGEFIGTMTCPPEVTTKDFDVRGLRWLGELLGEGTSAG